MTSSRSSSSSALAALLAAAALLGACRAAPPPAPRPAPPRLVLYPVQNLTGGSAPARELTAALRAQLLTYGVVLVPDEEVQRTLANHRIRYTGGVDREAAQALRSEAGADGVIIPVLEAYSGQPPFRMAMTTRLVSTGDEPAIRWIEAFARGGADDPGLLAAGVWRSLELMRDDALEKTARALARALERPQPVVPCPDLTEVPPTRMYRSPMMADPARTTIAVLPFLNDSDRRDAGDVLALRFLAPLVASGTVQVVEPGVVRSEMLLHRIGAGGGISLDDARVVLELLKADLVMSGAVRRFDESAGVVGAPYVEFGTWVLDRRTARLAWSSSSAGSGDAGVYFFGIGRVTTASGLACAMAKGAVGFMLEGRPPLPPAGSTAENSAGIAPPSGASARSAQDQG